MLHNAFSKAGVIGNLLIILIYGTAPVRVRVPVYKSISGPVKNIRGQVYGCAILDNKRSHSSDPAVSVEGDRHIGNVPSSIDRQFLSHQLLGLYPFIPVRIKGPAPECRPIRNRNRQYSAGSRHNGPFLQLLGRNLLPVSVHIKLKRVGRRDIHASCQKHKYSKQHSEQQYFLLQYSLLHNPVTPP